MASKKVIGVFGLVMMTMVSVDSMRNLATNAIFGTSIVFFFICAAIIFLLPVALVATELALIDPNNKGLYDWIKLAFGPSVAFVVIWLQWLKSIIWYPAILAFVAGTIGYLISPTLPDNKLFVIIAILAIFWGVTLINLFGMKVFVRFSNISGILGLVLPMLLLIGFGVHWILNGHPLRIYFTYHNMIPALNKAQTWVALTGVMLSFCGIEVATVHASHVRKPHQTFPTAMLLSTILILSTMLIGALCIAAVMPQSEINLVSGIMQTFHKFFVDIHLANFLFLPAIFVILGCIGGISNWIGASSRGLLVATKDDHLPKHFAHQNKAKSPVVLLIYQALIVSILCIFFVFLPTINAFYWLITVICAQVYMLIYLFMFAAGMRLLGKWLVAGCGFIVCLLTFMVGFIPPHHIIKPLTPVRYEFFLLTALIALIVPPFIINKSNIKKSMKKIKKLINNKRRSPVLVK